MSCLWRLGILVLCEYLISSTALAFTVRKSILRRLCTLCLIVLAILEIRLLPFLPGPELLRGVFAFSCIVKLLHFFSLFSILQVEIHQLINTPFGSSFARFCAGLNCVTSYRGIGTPWEIKTWSDCREPSKGRYITKNVIVLGWQYLVLDVLNFGALRYFHLNWPDALAAGAEFLSAGSTKEQLMARLPLSFILAANLRLLFGMVYGVLATISVLLEFTSPKDWPPLFGSMRHLQMFSIRSFWAKLWHQLLRWPLTTISWYIRQRLRFCTSSSLQAQRIIDLLLVFSMSGFLHVLSAVYAGVPDNLGAIFLFFIINPVLIKLEDICTTQVAKISCLDGIGILGFLWGLTWIYLCVPWFAYTALRLPVETNAVMPFSFVEQFGSHAVMGVVALGGIFWAFSEELSGRK